MIHKYNANEFLSRYFDVEQLELLNVLDSLPSLSKEGPWLAGGAIRRTLIQQELNSDFDFFFRDEKQLSEFRKEIERLGAKQTKKTEHQETYMLDIEGKNRIIQLIKIDYYQNAESVIDSFDFTITQLAYDGTELYCGGYTLWDLARKRLALHKLTFGVSSLRRMIKYTKQGFTACSGVLQAILEAVAKDPNVIQSDVEYVD